VLGLIAVMSRRGRWPDHAHRRRAATFPAILIALLINGVVKSVMGNRLDAMSTLAVLVFAIGLSSGCNTRDRARLVMVEKEQGLLSRPPS